jgi:hypothetical protein
MNDMGEVTLPRKATFAWLIAVMAAGGCAAAPSGAGSTVISPTSTIGVSATLTNLPPTEPLTPPPTAYASQTTQDAPTTIPSPFPAIPAPTSAPTLTGTPVVCATAWFASFPTQACADGPAVSLEAAYETFESGAMLWRKGGEFVILPINPGTGAQNGMVSFEPDNITAYRDTSVDYVAPAGLFAPVSGFGILWRGDNQQDNTWSYRQILGWATAPEQGYTVTEQHGTQIFNMGTTTATALVTAFTMPDGRILVLARLAAPNQPTTINFYP